MGAETSGAVWELSKRFMALSLLAACFALPISVKAESSHTAPLVSAPITLHKAIRLLCCSADLEADYIDDYMDKDLTHEKNTLMLVLCFMTISILRSGYF